MKVITIATEYNKYVEEWERSAKMFGYDYKIVGLGEKWEGFNTLMKLILDELKNYKDDDIILKVDCYDLVFADGPENLLKAYYKLMPDKKNRVLFGSENYCMDNCEDSHINSCNIPLEKTQKYLNGGFLMGPVKILREGYEYCLKYGNGDDQIGWAKYFSKNCDNIILDYNSDIVLNYSYKRVMTPYIPNIKLPELILQNNNKIYNKTFNNYPIVIHMPYQTSDLGKRSEFVRKMIIPDREPIKKIDYFIELIEYIKKVIKYPVYKKIKNNIIISIIISISIFFYYVLQKSKITS